MTTERHPPVLDVSPLTPTHPGLSPPFPPRALLTAGVLDKATWPQNSGQGGGCCLTRSVPGVPCVRCACGKCNSQAAWDEAGTRLGGGGVGLPVAPAKGADSSQRQAASLALSLPGWTTPLANSQGVVSVLGVEFSSGRKMNKMHESGAGESSQPGWLSRPGASGEPVSSSWGIILGLAPPASGSSRHLSPLRFSVCSARTPPLLKTPGGLMVSFGKLSNCVHLLTISASFSSVCGLFSCWV